MTVGSASTAEISDQSDNAFSDQSLESALQLSAMHFRAVTQQVALTTQRSVSRQSLKPRLDHHVSVWPVATGVDEADVIQIDVCNQFCSRFVDLSGQFDGPGAICGWMRCG